MSDSTTRATAAGREPRGLRVTGLAPRGALPGCPGRIVLTIDKNNCGSWSTPCSLDLSLDCEAPGCWWSRNEWDGEVDAELFGVAASMHALDAYEEARRFGARRREGQVTTNIGVLATAPFPDGWPNVPSLAVTLDGKAVLTAPLYVDDRRFYDVGPYRIWVAT